VPTQTVNLVTLDLLLKEQQIPYVDVMKIDIEGYEYEAILGSPDVFRRHRIGAVILELHRELLARRGLKPEAITDFLGECGYRIMPGFDDLVYVCDSPRDAHR
jgi:hypothetical protein